MNSERSLGLRPFSSPGPDGWPIRSNVGASPVQITWPSAVIVAQFLGRATQPRVPKFPRPLPRILKQATPDALVALRTVLEVQSTEKVGSRSFWSAQSLTSQLERSTTTTEFSIGTLLKSRTVMQNWPTTSG